MFLAGIDEAGLGPALGPLTTCAAVFRTPDDRPGLALNPEAFFGGACLPATPDARTAKRDRALLPVADSKQVHAVGGLPLLHRTISAFWPLPPHEGFRENDAMRVDRTSLLKRLGAEDAIPPPGLAPWHDISEKRNDPWPPGQAWPAIRGDAAQSGGQDPPAAPPATPPLSPRLPDANPKWSFAGFHARVTMPGALNQMFGEGLNKHDAALRAIGQLLTRLDGRHPNDSWMAVIDQQGGRRHYEPFLASCFPEAWVIREEAFDGRPERCLYRLRQADRPERRILFKIKADATCPPAALASMLAKWLREGFMAELNGWFGARLPGLAPTAGYPADAKRWLAQTAEYRLARRICLPQLVRQR